jgi:hypothetical protein
MRGFVDSEASHLDIDSEVGDRQRAQVDQPLDQNPSSSPGFSNWEGCVKARFRAAFGIVRGRARRLESSVDGKSPWGVLVDGLAGDDQLSVWQLQGG